MSTKQALVLLHGWGLNRRVWDDVLPCLSDFELCVIDLPGYGDRVDQVCPESIMDITQLCLEQAPESAIWLGWSLGGMVALQAAAWDAKRRQEGKTPRISGLCLINTTPCFAETDNWPHGVSVSNMQVFAEQLARDYQKTLNGFLLLQAGGTPSARKIVKKTAERISKLSMPRKQTLMAGIECLRTADLRLQLDSIAVPAQIVSGRLDRIIKPSASDYLAEQLNAEHTQFNDGHSPFLNQPEQFCQVINEFASSLNAPEVGSA